MTWIHRVQWGAEPTQKVLSLVLIALLLVPALVDAKDKEKWSDGFYIGIGVGGGRIDADLDEIGLDLPPPPAGTGETIVSNSYNDTALAYKIFAGYRFIDYFAIEGGYFSFEESDERFCFIDDLTGECANSRFTTPAELEMPTADSSIVSSTQWEVNIPLDGATFFGVGIFPISDRFEFFGKVGAVVWEMDGYARERVVGGFVDTSPPNDNQQGFPPGNPRVSIGPGQRNTDDSGTDFAGGLGFNFNSETNITIRTEMEYFDIPKTNDVWFLSLSAIYNF